jgi:hypothetical protein
MPSVRTLLACLLLALTTFAATTFAAEEQLKLLGTNDPVKGQLVAIDGKTLIFKTDEKTVTKPVAEVLSVDLQPAPPPGGANFHQVELTDGSILNCKTDGIEFKDKSVLLTLTSGAKLECPITALSYILKNAHDPQVRDNADWKIILKSRKNEDRLVRWFQGRLNGIDGTIPDGKGTSINFILSGTNVVKPLDLTHQAIQGCVFVNKPDASAPPTVCRLFDMNQNLLMVSKLELAEGGKFVFTTVSGAKLEYGREQVSRVDYSWGKRTFLSDLDKDTTVLAEPGEEFSFPNRFFRDKNGEGNQLQLSGKRFPKGLFIPARTKLAFKVNGDYNEFTALIGVDEAIRGRSHVRLIIEGDGKELFAGEFKNGEKPREVRVNIKDIQELRISVEPMNLASLDGNHLDLADAKISK